MDRSLNAAVARYSTGLSPMALVSAYWDWASHLGFAPGKRLQLTEKAGQEVAAARQLHDAAAMRMDGIAPCIEPLPQDRRFVNEAWQKPPFNVIYQSFLLTQQWWHNATTGVRGVTRKHEKMVAFGARQFLDMVSPANFIATNPEVLERTVREGGAEPAPRRLQLCRGLGPRAWEANARRVPTHFKVGRDVAITPGQRRVAQSADRTDPVRAGNADGAAGAGPDRAGMDREVLHSRPESQVNSLVKYLTEQGHTVFMISWRNPGPDDRDLTMEDYRQLGVMAALDAVTAIVPGRGVHAVGYCIGGTMLAIAAAAMARDGDRRLASTSFFAAQTDFTEAGELMLFIDESQLAFLEDVMWEQGFLDSRQMAGAFQLLRSNDLVWSRAMRTYLLGEREPMTDLMAWNVDATRMPYRMHADYLRSMFLDNDLAEGQIQGRRSPRRVEGPRDAAVRRGHRTRSRGAVAVGLQVPPAHGHGSHVPADQRRPQCRHRLRARASGAALSCHVAEAGSLVRRPRRCGWPIRRCMKDRGGRCGRRGSRNVPARRCRRLPMGNAEAGYAPLGAAPGTYVLQP